jgi:hypothetical protein
LKWSAGGGTGGGAYGVGWTQAAVALSATTRMQI